MRRVKRAGLVVLTVAAVALLARYVAAPWVVKAYYVRLFSNAEQIIIHRAGRTPETLTISRGKDSGAFQRIEGLVRNGRVQSYPCKCAASWTLDVIGKDGSKTAGVWVCHYLQSPQQPLKGRLWFYPLVEGYDEPDPGIIDEIELMYRSARERRAGSAETSVSPTSVTSANPASGVKEFWMDAFRRATVIRIRQLRSDEPPLVVTRAEHPEVFGQFEAAVEQGQVKDARCGCRLGWEMDLTLDDGTRMDRVGVMHYLSSEARPGVGFLYPASPLNVDDLPSLVERLRAKTAGGG